MKKHQTFTYHGYTVDTEGFSYHFSMDDIVFRPKWTCDIPPEMLGDDTLNALVFNLGMVELVSYWKAACPLLVKIACGQLDEWQTAWWKKLYRKGLGEFFYLNNITPDGDFMHIECTGAPLTVSDSRTLSGCLIPVGGGKDSIVTLELLRDGMDDNCCYIVGDIKRAYDSARTAGYPDSRIVGVKRAIDPMLIELNRRGYLNGHTPFSAIVAFSSLIFAYLSGKKYIVLSNESSANEGNVGGADVNHQYSKSTEFERDFREYAARLSPALPEYFSLLRPWNELQITRVFTRFPQYFTVFQSCNAGTKTNTWCCKCAKCVYVYAMLAAFLDDEALQGIFGADLLADPALAELLDALINPDVDKPFECVGTREEVALALRMAAERRGVVGATLDGADLLRYWDNDNFLPQCFAGVFK
ncbi:MAG: hypothetical protein FWG45_06030 [Oscillospiraceae bacterium]|nr:hypothetical protein [Oscillospiraceae bacterium]